MKKRFRVLINIFAITILIIGIFLIRNYISIRQEINFGTDEKKYHFFVLLNGKKNEVWERISNGMETAAEEYDVAIEIHDSDAFAGNFSIFEYFKIALLSEVDGIALNISSDDKKYKELLQDARRSNIPVVTVMKDIKENERTSFVGMSSFDFGKTASEIALSAVDKSKIQIAVIIQRSDSLINNDLLVMGMNSIPEEENSIEIVTIETSEFGIVGAEDATYNIIKEYPGIDVILCTSPGATIGAAQALIDINKVNEIKIIGFGKNEKITDLVKKEIIYGSIMIDSEKIGYDTISTLIKIKKGEEYDDSNYSGINYLTKDNYYDWFVD